MARGRDNVFYSAVGGDSQLVSYQQCIKLLSAHCQKCDSNKLQEYLVLCSQAANNVQCTGCISVYSYNIANTVYTQ